ncbi:hypothetical protein DFP72DRAFT_855155 [Ephemerocybe angulata]|uniref:Uncharacterized protein n=1 Tax=Ephemerocybe angulata TaxID=980116 RepID=A0A8H6HIW0_9AGAR|nr:hypothetical protein DFP72DRAFT_855155 [Tulosesus angulatus]
MARVRHGRSSRISSDGIPIRRKRETCSAGGTTELCPFTSKPPRLLCLSEHALVMQCECVAKGYIHAVSVGVPSKARECQSSSPLSWDWSTNGYWECVEGTCPLLVRVRE